MKIPSRLIKSIERHGTRKTLVFALEYLLSNFLTYLKVFSNIEILDSMNSRRVYLGEILRKDVGHDFIIRGHFQHVLLPPVFSWSSGDRVSMQLGFYEREVTEYLQKVSGPSKIFIDVGAADGYFAVSLVAKRMFSKAICFEVSVESRRILCDNAVQNNVYEKIDIRGGASFDTLVRVIDQHADRLDKLVFLVDIEGGEIELLSSQLLVTLSQSILVIEMHPRYVAEEVLADFKERCAINHDVSLIVSGARNPSEAPELDSWLDNDRWNVCSEGRYRGGLWLVLEPKNM